MIGDVIWVKPMRLSLTPVKGRILGIDTKMLSSYVSDE